MTCDKQIDLNYQLVKTVQNLQPGSTDEVESLLKQGASPNAAAGTDPNGETSFHLSLFREELEVIDLMLDYGADVDKPHRKTLQFQTQSGEIKEKHEILTPFQIAVQGSSGVNIDMAQRLIDRGADTTPLFNGRDAILAVAANQGDIEMFRHLLDTLPNPLQLSAGENTVLHQLAWVDDPDMIDEVARRFPVDPNQQNGVGATPLHIAMSLGSPETTVAFLRLGADASIANNSGRVPTDNARPETLDALHVFTSEKTLEAIEPVAVRKGRQSPGL